MAPSATLPASSASASIAATKASSAPPPRSLGTPLVLPAVSPAYLEQHDNAAKATSASRDLRSDTLTVPTDEMLQASFKASRGDDVYEEDPTTTAFQAEVAALMGKEAGLFVVSGTLSNQLALRTHLLQPPYSILTDARGHVHRYEAGGAAFHSGAALLPITPANGHHLTWDDDILPNLSLGEDIHTAPTRVISLENSLNGLVFPQDEIEKISRGARELGIKMHLDGARIWNVAAETGLSLEELARPFDTISCCFSKGLGAPVGSMLVGPAPFIRKATHFRKLFGAGIRQSGGLAAAARYGLTHHFPKLKATHELARWTEGRLADMGVTIMSGAETSMVFIDPSPLGFTASELAERAASLSPPIRLGGARLVFHHQVEDSTMLELLDLVSAMKEENKHKVLNLAADEGGLKKIRDAGANLYAGMRR